MIAALTSESAAAAWDTHLDACATCGDLDGETACEEGQRLVFALELAEDAEDRLLPEMAVSASN